MDNVMTEKPEKAKTLQPGIDYRKQDRITLKKLKYFDSGSQETHCFTASVYFDGQLVCTVENAGHGGCDDHTIANRARWDAMQKYISTFECINTAGGDWAHSFMPDLDCVVCELVNQALTLQDIKTRLRSRVYLVIDGVLRRTKTCNAATRDAWAAQYREKPGVTVLNGLPDAELLAVYEGLES